MKFLFNLFLLYKTVPVLLVKAGLMAPTVTEYDENGALWSTTGPNASGAQVAPSITVKRYSQGEVAVAGLTAFYALRELL